MARRDLAEGVLVACWVQTELLDAILKARELSAPQCRPLSRDAGTDAGIKAGMLRSGTRQGFCAVAAAWRTRAGLVAYLEQAARASATSEVSKPASGMTVKPRSRSSTAWRRLAIKWRPVSFRRVAIRPAAARASTSICCLSRPQGSGWDPGEREVGERAWGGCYSRTTEYLQNCNQ